MKALLKSFTLFMFCLLATHQVSAHGNTEPQHGGIVKIVGEYTFELVRKETLTELYVSYEDDGLNASEITGSLKIKSGKDKQKYALEAGQGNKLFLNKNIIDGSTVLAMITLADGTSKIVAKYKL